MTATCIRILSRPGFRPGHTRFPFSHRVPPRPSITNACYSLGCHGRSFTTFIEGRHKPGDEEVVSKLRDSLITALKANDNTTVHNRGFVILVTPSHAGLVSDTTVIGKIIEEAVLTQGSAVRELDGVAAVVDGLPGQTPSDGLEGWAAMVTDQLPRIYTSSGKDWLAHPRSFKTQDPETPTEASQPQETSRDPNENRGELQLVFPFRLRWRKEKHETADMATVKFQLANTIFQTGRTATAVHYSYRIKPVPGQLPLALKSNRDYLNNMTVRLHPSQIFKAVVSWPLRALTPPRKIESSNGNIIKEISAPDDSDAATLKTVPASRELEAAVGKWLDRHPGYDPATLRKHPLEVYAGIVKPPQRDGKTIDPLSAMTMYNLNKRDDGDDFHKKYKFAKVVSGGGGWGNQGGLVALDPDGMEGFRIPGEEQLPEVTEAKSILGPDIWVQFFIVDPTIQLERESRRTESADFVFVSNRDIDQGTWESIEDIQSRFKSSESPSEYEAPEGTTHADGVPVEHLSGGTTFEKPSSFEESTEDVSEEILTERSPSKDLETMSEELASPNTTLETTTPSPAEKPSLTETRIFINGSLWANDQKVDAPYSSIALTLKHRDLLHKDAANKPKGTAGLPKPNSPVANKEASLGKDYMNSTEVVQFMDFLKTMGLIKILDGPMAKDFKQTSAWYLKKWKEGVRGYVNPPSPQKALTPGAPNRIQGRGQNRGGKAYARWVQNRKTTGGKKWKPGNSANGTKD
ncbi:hypothetical protein TWF696_002876 [Orbilia brochopaga]|uniref:Uncharacterized protein n=1 Tax=Orbilia brochopaga TaxID=3140254 RepID=A0AAV9U0X4_9PEZI